jgi:hypothetical protein
MWDVSSISPNLSNDHLLKFENKIKNGYFHILRSAPLGQNHGCAPDLRAPFYTTTFTSRFLTSI